MMRYSDLHVHTTFSDGKNTVEEMVLAAIQKGMVSVGISDHSYTPYDLRYCMKREQEAEYCREIRRVRELYRDQIEVYVGLEYDGYSELAHREAFDYLIGDCHYIKTWDGYHSVDHAQDEQWHAIETYFGGNPIAYSKAYFETYVERTRLHRPDILGHFDLTSKFGYVDETDSVYQKMAIEALLACLEITPILELNTGAVVRGWRKYPFPNTLLLKAALEHGGKILFSSDSHQIAGLTGWFSEAAELIKDVGFRSMIVLRGGQFEEVGI